MTKFWLLVALLNAISLYGALHSTDVWWAALAGAATAASLDSLARAILRGPS